MVSRLRLFLIAGLAGWVLAGGLFPIGAGRLAYATPPPNVVMFLADDMGWTDWQYDATLNPTGSKLYETPNLLALAQRGVQFTSAYASAPICSPTRAAILTGKSPAHIRDSSHSGGLTNFLPGTPNTTNNLKEPTNWQNILPGNNFQPNLAYNLEHSGYATGVFGKWHLGTTDPTCACYGFDSNVGGTYYGGPGDGTAGGWFAGADGAWGGMPGINTPGTYPSDKYLSDAITEKAGDFIQQHANQPFFLASWDYQSHIPLQAPQNLIDKYTAKIATLQGQGVDLKGQTNATYAAMIEKMDQDVGALMTRLDDPNLDNNHSDSVLNNTVFIFTSDNGGVYAADGNPTRNLPLREGKGSIYEGGIRVPFLVSYGADANIAQGSKTTARTSLYDLYPTIFDFAGVAMPGGNTIDGVDIRSAIEGANFDRGLLYWHYPHRSNQAAEVPSLITGGSFVSAVSNKDWKLIFFYDDRHYELYNLTTDIGETTNLLAYNPGIAHDLSLALQNYLVGIGAQMPLDKTTSVAVAPPTVLAAPIAGDYNGDSVVDLADYNFWRLNFGSIDHLAADGNGNGIVDAADYVFWRKIYLAGSGSSLGGSGTVPEPTTAILFALGLGSYAISMRRRRTHQACVRVERFANESIERKQALPALERLRSHLS